MNRTHTLLIACGLMLIRATVSLGQGHPEGLNDIMIPPQLIMQHADELSLDDGQKQFIQSKVQEMQEKYPDLQQNLQKQVGALGELLHQDHPDEQKALAQLDKVLDSEREIKRAQMSLALSIRGKLTPEQQGKLRDMRQKMMAEAHEHGQGQQPPESLRAKMQQVQQLVQKLHEDGKDASDIQPLMEKVQPLVRDGKFKEAEESLDRVIKSLQEAQSK
jgi:Spy/CpxP family protein refolding chaperone